MCQDNLDYAAIWEFLCLQEHHAQRVKPRSWYALGREDVPESARMQLHFHRSPHVIRAMFPGNGAGKTTAAGVEVDMWIQHSHMFPDQNPIQPHAISVLWVCLYLNKLDNLRQQLEDECLTAGYKWNEQKKKYTWASPALGSLTFGSNDGDWESFQGGAWDLVVVDEECDSRLMRELLMRRRGRRQTRYVIAATATRGKNWMYSWVYKPWLDFHGSLAMSEEQAMLEQRHPTIWVWPRGGIENNPGAGRYDKEWYDNALRTATPAERRVRSFGGFQDFNASPVFDLDVLGRIEQENATQGVAGHDGWLRIDKEGRPDDEPAVIFVRGLNPPGIGRLTIYEMPESDYYSVGADFCYGLESGDADAAVVLRKSTGRQVAAACGQWGDVTFARLLWWLCLFYDNALLVGERQVGLPSLRRIYDEFGYQRLYYEIDPQHAAPRHSDYLGHAKTSGDMLIPELACALRPMMEDGTISPPQIHLADPQTIEQCKNFQNMPRVRRLELTLARNNQIKQSAPSGQHDDLVMACGYAWMGLQRMGQFPKHRARLDPDSAAAILGHQKVWLEMEKRNNPRVPHR